MTPSQPAGDGTGATEGAEGVPVSPEQNGGRKSSRSRASAKKAGTWLETLVATYLNLHVDDRIERRTKNGTKDRGDIGGLRHMGQRVVIECKNTAKPSLGTWATEAEIERGNDDALAGIIVHKRHGKGRAEDQWVTLTLGELVALLTGDRSHYDQEPQ